MQAIIKNNAGKIALGIILLAAAAAIFAFQGRDKPARSDKVLYVCVETGKTFQFERGPAVLPRQNPETGRNTLLPCSRHDDGTLVIGSRLRATVEELDKQGLNKFVDLKTLEVKKTPQ